MAHRETALRDVYRSWEYNADASDEPADWHAGEFLPGERIGAPHPSRTASMGRDVVGAAVILALGWLAVQTHATWRPWLALSLIKIRAEVVRNQSSAPKPELAAALPAPVEPLGAAKEVATIAGTASSPPQTVPAASPTDPPAPPVETGSLAPETAPAAAAAQATATETEAAAPLPEPEVDPADPHQKRAAAAGLHPRVSKVVLASLTEADYRNVKTAISKALAEIGDTGKFIWPRDPGTKQAVFQVHFVEGAAPSCRRYIVTIVKNGWTTTAPPMEKCGLKTAARNDKDAPRPPGAPAEPNL